jgi:hypothetical protein
MIKNQKIITNSDIKIYLKLIKNILRNDTNIKITTMK